MGKSWPRTEQWPCRCSERSLGKGALEGRRGGGAWVSEQLDRGTRRPLRVNSREKKRDQLQSLPSLFSLSALAMLARPIHWWSHVGDQGKAPNSSEADSKILGPLRYPSVTHGSQFQARAGPGASLTSRSFTLVLRPPCRWALHPDPVCEHVGPDLRSVSIWRMGPGRPLTCLIGKIGTGFEFFSNLRFFELDGLTQQNQ